MSFAILGLFPGYFTGWRVAQTHYSMAYFENYLWKFCVLYIFTDFFIDFLIRHPSHW